MPRRTTAALIAAAATLSLGAAPAPAAAPDREGDQRPAIDVKLRVGAGDVRRVETRAYYPYGVLRKTEVERSRFDKVRVRREGRTLRNGGDWILRDGDLVRVIRIDKRVKVHRVAVRQGTVVRKTTSIAPGRRKVVSQGRPGVRKVRVVHWWRNGKPVDTDVFARVVRKPAPRRVLLGVKERSVPGTGHLNWGALAECESGGNPRAVNPAGYYGLYQFSVPTWQSVGGSGMPHHASPGEQTYRAQKLYAQRGRSPWPYCGRYL